MKLKMFRKFSEWTRTIDDEERVQIKLMGELFIKMTNFDRVANDFEIELNQNLLETINRNQKEHIIAYYFSEFGHLLDYLFTNDDDEDDEDENLDDDQSQNEIVITGEYRGNSRKDIELFEVQRDILADLIFSDINYAAKRYNVNANKIFKSIRDSYIDGWGIRIDDSMIEYYFKETKDSQDEFIKFPRYVRGTTKLLKAEEWAKGEVGLLDKDGKWIRNDDKKFLSAFITYLRDKEIFKFRKGDRGEADKYFYDRYKCEFITSKLSEFNKTDRHEAARQFLVEHGIEEALR